MNEAMTYAVTVLTRREHSAAELARKLARKGHEASLIADTISQCQRLGLQDDGRFIENFSRTRIRQGYGPRRIIQELQAHQLDEGLIASFLQQEADNWADYALAVWKKKYTRVCEPSSVSLQKQKQFLYYRGFSVDTINQVIHSALK